MYVVCLDGQQTCPVSSNRKQIAFLLLTCCRNTQGKELDYYLCAWQTPCCGTWTNILTQLNVFVLRRIFSEQPLWRFGMSCLSEKYSLAWKYDGYKYLVHFLQSTRANNLCWSERYIKLKMQVNVWLELDWTFPKLNGQKIKRGNIHIFLVFYCFWWNVFSFSLFTRNICINFCAF